MEMSETELQMFIDTVVHYFSQTTAELPEVAAPFIKGSESVFLEYTGVIGICGKTKGAIYFTANSELLLQLLDAQGAGGEVTDTLLQDMVGEVANTLSGNARKFLGGSFMVSVPVVAKWTQSFQLPASLKIFVIPIIWRGMRCYLILSLGQGAAIYGSLHDTPFPHLVEMASRGGAQVNLHNLPCAITIELHVQNGNLRKLLVDGVPADERADIQAWIDYLHTIRAGDFEIIRVPMVAPGMHSIPLKQLLETAIANTGDTGEPTLDLTADDEGEELPAMETLRQATSSAGASGRARHAVKLDGEAARAAASAREEKAKAKLAAEQPAPAEGLVGKLFGGFGRKKK